MASNVHLIKVGSRAFLVAWMSLVVLLLFVAVIFLGPSFWDVSWWLTLSMGIVAVVIGYLFARQVSKNVLTGGSDAFGHSVLGLLLTLVSVVLIVGLIAFLPGDLRLTAAPAPIRTLPSIFFISMIAVVLSFLPILAISWPLSEYLVRLRNKVV
ncbi:MAG: hypothetical protein EOO88_23075 [Pedobacter sp.]|nr:MAG: hypothetical protein EOO88_23075 [Pedobacter sp.]